MLKRRCRSCRGTFQVLRNPTQHYCSKRECQKSRRCGWHQQKYKKDSDYRANKRCSQQAWLKHHPDYYQRYRKAHPNYMAKNKALQKERNKRNRPQKVKENGEEAKIVKMNTLLTDLSLISIPYNEFVGQIDLIAKMYAFNPKKVQLSTSYRHFGGKLK